MCVDEEVSTTLIDASDPLEAGEPALSIYQWALLREYPSPKSSQTGHYYRAWWKRDVRPEEFDKVFHKSERRAGHIPTVSGRARDAQVEEAAGVSAQPKAAPPAPEPSSHPSLGLNPIPSHAAPNTKSPL